MGIAAQHEAVLHASPADLARRIAPRIGAVLGGDGLVVASLDPAHRDALRAELGDAADAVEFAEPARVHSVPGFTVAVRWARTGRRVRAGAQALVVDQYRADLQGCGPGHWARLDIALNIALAGQPVTVLCPYPEQSPELARVRATHPVLCLAGGTRESPGYRPPREALIDFPPPPPPDLGTPVAVQRFAHDGLPALRGLVEETATAAGLPREGTADLVLAVSEMASNSIEHGPGHGMLRLWERPDGELVAEVADTGGGMDVPFPGVALPPPEGARGRGLWLASELCDVLQVWSDDDSTVVRMHLRR